VQYKVQEKIGSRKITIENLRPGKKYLATVTLEKILEGTLEKILIPIFPTCSCASDSGEDKTGRPAELTVMQKEGHVMFTFVDKSRCEAAFAFSRLEGFSNYTDYRRDANSFTNDFTYNGADPCDGLINPGTEASDDLKISRLTVGESFTYCVRAVKNGKYMDLSLSDDKQRVVSSSGAICERHTIHWEASIDGLVTTEPNAGSLPIKKVEIAWQLLSEDGSEVLDCLTCKGETKSDEGGAFRIDFNVGHRALNDKNLVDIPIRILFTKETQTRNGGLHHKFLCNYGQDRCDSVHGYTVYLKHLHFDTPLHIYDDTSLPFRGYLTVYNTQYPGSADGCIIADAQVCLQHYTTTKILSDLVCVNSQSDGMFEAPVMIGAVINNVKINYSTHKFKKTFKNDWDYAKGVVISDGGFYSGNDFMDVTRAKLNIQGMFPFNCKTSIQKLYLSHIFL